MAEEPDNTETTEPEQQEDTKTQPTPKDTEQTPKPEEKIEEPSAKYTDADVDRIVQKRLARAEQDKQIAVDEAKKLAKMNADQKRDYELKKAQDELDATKKQLATFEMAKTARQMIEDSGSEVTEDDLQHIVTPDADTTKANVQWLLAHDKATAERVRKEYLKGSTPKSSGSPIHPVTQEEFNQMTYAERAELATKDPTTFSKLTGGN